MLTVAGIQVFTVKFFKLFCMLEYFHSETLEKYAPKQYTLGKTKSQ